MKFITGSLLKFAFFFASGSILFRLGLSWSITHHTDFAIWIIAVLYFILNSFLGWFFGSKDYESFPLYDIGLRFHLVTYIVFNIIGELWFLLGFQSQFEKVIIVHQIALFWGIFLVLHFVFYLFTRKNSFKGLDKSEIFE